MKVTQTQLPEVLIIEPQVFYDERGFFFESFNQEKYNEIFNDEIHFNQDNHSSSRYGIARGLHYQLQPKAQGKLIRVVAGSIFDVAVDIRKSSPNFGKWIGVELNDKNHKQLWIPVGFAHGFVTLSANAEVLYKATDFYSPQLERVLSWFDTEINIYSDQFDLQKIILSEKDKLNAKNLVDAELFM